MQHLQAWPESCQQHWLSPWQAFRTLLLSAKSTKSTLFIPVRDDSDRQSRDSSLFTSCIFYDALQIILVYNDIFFFFSLLLELSTFIFALSRFSLEIHHDGFFCYAVLLYLWGAFDNWCCVFIYRLYLSLLPRVVYILISSHIIDVLIMSHTKDTSVMFRLWRLSGGCASEKDNSDHYKNSERKP